MENNTLKYDSSVELGNRLVKLIANNNVTNRLKITGNINEIALMKTELVKFGILKVGEKWVHELTAYMGKLEKVLNILGYATKKVRREREHRTTVELQISGAKYNQMEVSAKDVFRKNLIANIAKYNVLIAKELKKLQDLEK